jgi:hypothetical protein
LKWNIDAIVGVEHGVVGIRGWSKSCVISTEEVNAEIVIVE